MPARTSAPADAETPPLLSSEEASKPDALSPGLLSRLTPSQLLRRATGGRTESFSPDSDEIDDLPLEPGTDSPLSSALVNAPSADTAILSGSRPRSNRPDSAFASTGSLDEGRAEPHASPGRSGLRR